MLTKPIFTYNGHMCNPNKMILLSDAIDDQYPGGSFSRSIEIYDEIGGSGGSGSSGGSGGMFEDEDFVRTDEEPFMGLVGEMLKSEWADSLSRSWKFACDVSTIITSRRMYACFIDGKTTSKVEVLDSNLEEHETTLTIYEVSERYPHQWYYSVTTKSGRYSQGYGCRNADEVYDDASLKSTSVWVKFTCPLCEGVFSRVYDVYFNEGSRKSNPVDVRFGLATKNIIFTY